MNKKQITLSLLVSGNPTDAMKAAAENNLFYADATPLFNGQFALGGTDNVDDKPVAVVYPTLDEAQEELDDMADEYRSQIDAGERDEDDVPDGMLVQISVNDDGLLNITEVEGDLMSTQTMLDAIGE